MTLERGVCISCPREIEYKGSQAGHFIAGRTNSILLDEDLVHLQCYHCNMGLSGNYVEYFVAMEKLYDREAIDTFRARKAETAKMTIDEWEARAAHYKARTIGLIIQFNKDKYSPLTQHLVRLGVTLGK